MPLPPDPQEFFAFAAKGDADAIEYLDLMAQFVYLADDAVDEVLDADTRQDMMVRLLWILFVALPRNRFYARHQIAMSGIMAQVLIFWQTSDHWKMYGDEKRKHFAYVRREAMDGLVAATAGLIGGASHARDVVERLMDDCHAETESFDEWVAEAGR